MKKVLSLLVAFVFLQVQSWALSGGPVYSGSTASVKGTYAGSMIPSIAGNSLGIFAMGVPETGLASGVFAMFVDGAAFYGSIVGIIDPDKLTLNALAQAQQTRTSVSSSGGTVSTTQIPVALASGVVKATLETTNRSGFTNSKSGGFRIVGSGALQTFTLSGGTPIPATTIDVTVDGFQQSTTVDSTININSLTGTQSSGSGS